MLRYCGWCGVYQGATPHPGYQIRSNVCEIDTTTICPACLAQYSAKGPRSAGGKQFKERRAAE